MIPKHLEFNSRCAKSICRNAQCAEAVKQADTGAWFITMGHAGFNTIANNRAGYKTEKSARITIAKYERKANEYLSKVGR